MISPDKSQGKAKDDDFFSLSDNDPLFQDDLHEYEEDNDIPTPDHAFINKGLKKQSADGLKQQRKVFVTYENQRWWLSQWTNTLLPGGIYAMT